MIVGHIGGGSVGGYQVQRSVRLRSAASAYFSRTFGTATSRTTFTISFWTKRGTLGGSAAVMGSSVSAGAREVVGFFGNTSGSGDSLHFRDTSGGAYEVTSTAVYRDPSAEYHCVIAFDTTQATASNRVKMYMNGVQITSFAVASYPAQNTQLYLNAAAQQAIGQRGDAATYLYDGLLSEFYFIDGQALTPTSFAEQDTATRMWVPKKYTGSFGTNGFYLDFSDITSTTTLGYDKSGNGNNWTANNISLTSGSTYDSMLDVPGLPWADGGNGRGNYATWNPLDAVLPAAPTDGNLYVYGTGAHKVRSTQTFDIASDNRYFEWTCGASPQTAIGIMAADDSITTQTGIRAYYQDGTKFNGTGWSAYGASFTSGDVLGIKAGGGALEFFKNGVSQGVAFTGLTGRYAFVFHNQGAATSGGYANFGQRPFAFTPPTNFKALNTANLPDPTGAAAKPWEHFDVLLHTGNGGTQSVTGAQFRPDFLWIKNRNSTQNNYLQDSVRGITSYLVSNNTGVENQYSGAGISAVTGTLSNGFSLGTDAIGMANSNALVYVDWLWKAGGAAVSNTAGSITSQVSANTAAGVSVVTYTGTGANATVGHGLGVAPKMVIVKQRTNGSATSWYVWHAGLSSASYAIYLNATNAQDGPNAVFWNNTAPTSTVFSIGTSTGVSANTGTFVAYCFAEVPGFSKFGSYTGNGSSDGPFVFCGFRPRYVLIKRTDTAGNSWNVYDSSRDTYNAATKFIQTNTSDAEISSLSVDFVSNGFKIRNSDVTHNGSGSTYIYAAFAEAPFKYANAR